MSNKADTPQGLLPPLEPLPCPWCGGPGNVRHRPVDGRSPAKGYQYYVECTTALTTHCNIVTKGKLRDSKKRAIADWNARTPSTSPQPTLNSNALATLIFNHCVEVKFGCGKESLWQRDIQQIIDEWIADTGPSVSPSEECLMADCRNPQEHFCFQHCMEVYGTKAVPVDDERVKAIRERRAKIKSHWTAAQTPNDGRWAVLGPQFEFAIPRPFASGTVVTTEDIAQFVSRAPEDIDYLFSILSARPDGDSARVERLQAQLDGVMNCLAITQQEVERLRARPDVWEQAIAIIGSTFQGSSCRTMDVIAALQAARDAQQEGMK